MCDYWDCRLINGNRIVFEGLKYNKDGVSYKELEEKEKERETAAAIAAQNTPIIFYTIDKSGPNWIMTSGGGDYPVRVYTGNQLAYGKWLLKPGFQVLIQPNQWIEIWIQYNGGWLWAYAQDCDHR